MSQQELEALNEARKGRGVAHAVDTDVDAYVMHCPRCDKSTTTTLNLEGALNVAIVHKCTFVGDEVSP